MKRQVAVGSRASALAVAQTQLCLKSWSKLAPSLSFNHATFTTTGDQILDRALSQAGGKGLFIKELEEALQNQKIDMAIHSLKDVPAQLPEGFKLVAYPKRASPWDLLISEKSWSLENLPKQAIVGTSSLRRRAQLKKLRPDLNFVLLRGNIDTRLQKLKSKGLDAIVLAEAGLQRLGLSLDKAKRLPITPAPGQGILALESLVARQDLLSLVEPLHHSDTEDCALAERTVMAALGGGCDLPLGVFAQKKSGQMQLEAFLALPDASKVIEVKALGSNPLELAQDLLEKLFSKGAKDILKALGK